MRRLRAAAMALLLVLCLTFAVGATNEKLEEAIIRGCEEEKWVNLKEFEISEEDFEALFFQLRNDGKLPWYTDYSYSYYTGVGGKMDSFMPDSLDPEIYDRIAYELAVAEVMHQVCLPGMTPTQMALAVHDYLITHCVYDESLEKNTGYDLLFNGTTVCAGYSDLYMDILNRLGIPCVCVESDPMDHVWNLVYLEEDWYHVDVTWDDPTPDVYGQVEHSYFLLTDAQIQQGEEPHYGWVTDIVCDSERYTDGFWRDIYSPILYLDADSCIFRKEDENYVGTVYLYQESTQKQTDFCSNWEQYVNIGYGEYSYWHTGLSLWNGRIYFNNMTTVYSVNMDGVDRRIEYTHFFKEEKNFIAGSFVENDILYLSLSDHNFETSTPKQVELKPTGYHRHSYETNNIPASCETPEYTRHACSCGVEMLQSIAPANGHQLTRMEIQGETMHIGCTDCEDSYQFALPECVFFSWLPSMMENVFS